nr:hypothetical protein [Tanacetum cinerariifolium]
MHLGGEVDVKPSIVLDDSCMLQCFWVQIDCRSKHALEKFKSHVGVRSWFSTLQQASCSFLIDERVAWVDIEGVPLNAWTINTFTKITSNGEMHLGGEVDDKPSIVLDDSCILQCFWVQIDCRSKHALEKFKSHVGVRSWFSTLQQASSSFLIDKRVAWVDIEGVPLNAWTINTFTKITSKWGKLLYEEDKENLCLNSKRVSALKKFLVGFLIFMEDEDVEDESDEEIMDFRSKEGDSNLNKNNTPEGDSDIDEVPETIFDHDHEMPKQIDDEKDARAYGCILGASTPVELKRMQNVPYASAVGSIMYAVRCTRPDVAFAQNVTSRFQQNPGNLKRELRVSCYTDAGYLTDADDLKSQTGYVFVLNGGVVDWKSAKQIIFATSSGEAEYIAAFDASKEAVWVRKFISGLGVVRTIEEPIIHYLREVIEFDDIKLEEVHTDDNLADPFTKALAFPKHSEHTRNIGMLPAGSLM